MIKFINKIKELLSKNKSKRQNKLTLKEFIIKTKYLPKDTYIIPIDIEKLSFDCAKSLELLDKPFIVFDKNIQQYIIVNICSKTKQFNIESPYKTYDIHNREEIITSKYDKTKLWWNYETHKEK